MQATVKPDPGSSKVQVPKVNALGADVCSQRTWYYQKSKGFLIVKAFRNIESTQLSSTHQLMKWNKRWSLATRPSQEPKGDLRPSPPWFENYPVRLCVSRNWDSKNPWSICVFVYTYVYTYARPPKIYFLHPFVCPKFYQNPFCTIKKKNEKTEKTKKTKKQKKTKPWGNVSARASPESLVFLSITGLWYSLFP